MPSRGQLELLLYRFPPSAQFEGRLVGALERLESGGALRVRQTFGVRRDPETAELEGIALAGGRRGSYVVPLLDFRLDPEARRRMTANTLDGEEGTARTLRELGADLEPGWAIVGVLLEHVWAAAIDDAVERTGGAFLASAPVGAEASEAMFSPGSSSSPQRTPHP